MENEKNLKQPTKNKQSGSQMNSVSRFGNSPSNKQEAKDIKSKLEGTKSRNLQQNTNPVSLEGGNPSSLGNPSGL